jgi:hypothetical protein
MCAVLSAADAGVDRVLQLLLLRVADAELGKRKADWVIILEYFRAVVVAVAVAIIIIIIIIFSWIRLCLFCSVLL